jgi:hypothetical protein
MACIMILLAFVLQFTQNQVLHNRISAVDQAVNAFREIVKQEGCITVSNEAQLREKVAEILGCGEEDIVVSGERSPVFRGKVIAYTVEVPLGEIVTTASFWGISDEDNQVNYTISRYTTSEYTGR